jgi:uncharacterized membrane protein YjjP (DUF1212 family)
MLAATSPQIGLAAVEPLGDGAAPDIAFLLDMGKALHRYGVPAHRLEEMLFLLAARFGITGQFLSTPAAIFASFGPPEALRTGVPGLMLLVPGSLGFRSVHSLLARDIVGGVGTAFSMVLVGVAIVAGQLIANTVVPPRKAL